MLPWRSGSRLQTTTPQFAPDTQGVSGSYGVTTSPLGEITTSTHHPSSPLSFLWLLFQETPLKTFCWWQLLVSITARTHAQLRTHLCTHTVLQKGNIPCRALSHSLWHTHTNTQRERESSRCVFKHHYRIFLQKAWAQLSLILTPLRQVVHSHFLICSSSFSIHLSPPFHLCKPHVGLHGKSQCWGGLR